MLTVTNPLLSTTIENIHSQQTQISNSPLSVSDVYQNRQQQAGHPGVIVYNLGFKGLWRLITQNDGESVSRIGQFVDWLRGIKPIKQEAHHLVEDKTQDQKIKQKRAFKLNYGLIMSHAEKERFDMDRHGKFCQMHQYLSQDYPESKVNYNILCSVRYFSENKLSRHTSEDFEDLSCSCLHNLCTTEDDIFEIMHMQSLPTNVTTISRIYHEEFPIEIRYTSLEGAFPDFALDVLGAQEAYKLESCKDYQHRVSLAVYSLAAGLITLLGVGITGAMCHSRCKKKQAEKSIEAV